MERTLSSYWQNLSLPKQFVLAAVAVLLPGMILTGYWISSKVSDAVIRNTAAAIAISMDDMMAPLVAEISKDGEISEASRVRLDGLFAHVRDDKRIVSMKIWKPDGTVIFSPYRELVGKKFDLADDFKIALAGGIGADFDADPEDENRIEKQTGIKLLEVYAPVRDPVTRQVIAVSEFYANGDQLVRDVSKATVESWIFVLGVATAMLGMLALVAVKGGKTITAQGQQLQAQVSELQSLLVQNENLRGRLRQANEDVSSINENVLRHVGADLHDGPAQKLSYVALRLSGLKRLFPEGSAGAASVNNMSLLLGDALSDVRRVSGGLVLPELKELNIAQAIEHAIQAHESYTGTKVERKFDTAVPDTSLALRTCAYRLVQEGLTNAFKHAGGIGQVVRLSVHPKIVVEIFDKGPGIAEQAELNSNRLGLRGMRARVEALGGALSIGNNPAGGVFVWAAFPSAK